MGGNGSFLYGAKGLKEAVAEQKEEVTKEALRLLLPSDHVFRKRFRNFQFVCERRNVVRVSQVKQADISSDKGKKLIRGRKNTSSPKKGKIRQP